MKKLLFIWFVSIGLMTSCVENPEEDPDPTPPITSVLIKKMIVDDGFGGITTTTYTYSGNKLLFASRTMSGIETGRSELTYEGDLIQKEEVYEAGTLTTTYNYEYDASGNLVKCIKKDIIFEEGTKWIYVHTAGGNVTFDCFSGDLVAQTTAYSSGVITPTTVEETIFNGDGPEDDEVQKRTYTYDNKRMPIINVTGMDKVYFADQDRALNFANNYTKRVDQYNDNEPEDAVDITSITYYPNDFVKTAHGKIYLSFPDFYREVDTQYFY